MSLVVIVSCTTTSKNQKENNFVRVENGQFIRNGKPYYYIGTNFGMVQYWAQKAKEVTVCVYVANLIH